ncbi:MAG: hypothetical protein H2184_15825 [Candidatus Galacturonibacter soehngenii]|nr:hypothetical protein [Candidatus Galacturonibacter soehngenii]
MKVKKIKRTLKYKLNYLTIYLTALILTLPRIAHASEPSFVTNLINLGNDACTWAIAADATIATFVSIFHGIKWKTSSPDKKPAEVEAIKGTIFFAVLVAILGVVIKLVLSYFSAKKV